MGVTQLSFNTSNSGALFFALLKYHALTLFRQSFLSLALVRKDKAQRASR